MNPTTIPLHTGTSSYPPHHLSSLLQYHDDANDYRFHLSCDSSSVWLFVCCSSRCWNLAPTGSWYCYCYSGSCYYYCIFLVIVIVTVVLVVFFVIAVVVVVVWILTAACGHCCYFFPSCITWRRNQDIENIACKFWSKRCCNWTKIGGKCDRDSVMMMSNANFELLNPTIMLYSTYYFYYSEILWSMFRSPSEVQKLQPFFLAWKFSGQTGENLSRISYTNKIRVWLFFWWL